MVNGKDVNPFDMTNDNHMYVMQNRVALLRVLLNGKVVCKSCGYEFRSGSMGYLEVAEWAEDRDPHALLILLHCGKCSHEGPYTMTPNPFLEINKLDDYVAIVTKYRNETNSWPTESSMKEVHNKSDLLTMAWEIKEKECL